jgi:hypothetical protein
MAYIPKDPIKHSYTPDEEKKMLNTDKYCLNWACRRIYKQKDNHKKACKCHPGKWDFGYSG